MSSSRRSSTSRPTNPPAWRSLSMSKKSAPARSVTLVFAEPEQGSSLPSAATKLIPPRATNAGSSTDSLVQKRDRVPSIQEEYKSPGSATPASSKRARIESNASRANLSTESLQSTDLSGDLRPLQEPTPSVHDVSTAPEHTVIDVQALQDSPKDSSETALPVEPTQITHVPFPASEPDISPSNPSTPPGRSWFGSLSRSRGYDKESKGKEASIKDTQSEPAQPAEVEAQAPPVDSSPQPSLEVQPPPPTEPVVDPSKQEASPPSQPQAIPDQAHNIKRSWFSSSPTSSSRPPVSPTSPLLQSSNSIPSSIDEEVPRLSMKTPPPNPSPSVVQSEGGANAKLSSLNPSNSRFTLSIPLLGRPKMPLDRAVAVARGVDIRSEDTSASRAVNSSVTKTETESEIQPELRLHTEHIEQVASTPTTTASTEVSTSNEELSASSPFPDTPNETRGIHETTSNPSSTWWDYMSWSSGTNSPKPKLDEVPTDAPAVSLSASGSQTSTVKQSASMPDLRVAASPTSPESQTVPISAPGDTEDPRKSASDADLLKPDTGATKAQSVRSADSQISAWYAPWTWYGASSTPAIATAPDASSGSDSKTDSELVKEEALARDEAPAVPESSRSPVQELTNPIESSIATNKSGWASFFSSKSLVVKSITGGEQRDENGMEVMDLDEDEDHAGPSTTLAATAEINKAKETPQQPKPAKSPPPSPKNESNKPKDPVAPPLTNSESVKRSEKANAKRKSLSPAPSKKSTNGSPVSPRVAPPNLVLPSWGDTFHAPPRSLLPPQPTSTLTKTFKFVSGVLFSKDDETGKGKVKAREREFGHFGKELPRAWDIMGQKADSDVLHGAQNVVVIGIHGWFPGAVMRTVLGEPTGTSSKFVNMMVQALDEFQEKHKVQLQKITKIPLEGEGTIDRRVEKLYQNLLANEDWIDALHAADVIFVATHSQGSIVSTHLLDRLIRDRHIRTSRNVEALGASESLTADGINIVPDFRPQRICCLALCGIHLGPLRYLSTSSLLQPYIQYFESTAARELFEFQNTESKVSQAYIKALQNVVNHGTKMVYIASLNDQVVPIYSGLFTSASHPLILRALYIDGDAYHSSDFLSNLLVLLLRVLNSGLSDSGLLAHLSEATAGSLNGVGHSTVYEELATYSLAVNYLFLTNDGLDEHPELAIEQFDAKTEQNDYEIPWALRDLIADERVAHFFAQEIAELRDAFRDWHPKTAILRDVKRKLQPIQRLSSALRAGPSNSVSKL